VEGPDLHLGVDKAAGFMRVIRAGEAVWEPGGFAAL